jgi:hypothetical protein
MANEHYMGTYRYSPLHKRGVQGVPGVREKDCTDWYGFKERGKFSKVGLHKRQGSFG